MGLKEKLAVKPGGTTAGDTSAAPEYRENPEITAKIEKFRAENPKYVEYIKAMPRDRLENVAILRRIEGLENKERFRAAVENKVGNFLAANPEIAAAIDQKVAKLNPGQQPGARINMARRAMDQVAAIQAGKITI